jgi:ribonuclease BN (tRNA processing enzyme)
MKLAIFGSLASSLPEPGRNHLAFALEKDEGLHWFEAGENCSRTAAFMGYAPEKVRQIFISEFHTVTCGGLPGLFQRLSEAPGPTLPLHLPAGGRLTSFYALAGKSFSSRITEVPLQEKEPAETEGVKVLRFPVRDRENSYSFLIEAEGKKIVYSGLSGFSGEESERFREADMVLAAASCNTAPEICRKFKREKRKIGKLIFFHNGSSNAAEYEEMQNRVRDIWDGELYFAEDGEIFDI